MESTDRVGVLQTHNQKGENCGVIIRFSDLDEGVRDLINQYIPLLERCITLTDELRRVRDLTILTPEDIKLIDELLGDDDKGE